MGGCFFRGHYSDVLDEHNPFIPAFTFVPIRTIPFGTPLISNPTSVTLIHADEYREYYISWHQAMKELGLYPENRSKQLESKQQFELKDVSEECPICLDLLI